MICPFCKKECLFDNQSIRCDKAACSLFTRDSNYDYRFTYYSNNRFATFNYIKFLFSINDYIVKIENCNSIFTIKELTTNTTQEINDYPFVKIDNQITLDNLFSSYEKHCHLFIRSFLF